MKKNTRKTTATKTPAQQWLEAQPTEWLKACAENEGGRARLGIEGYSGVGTVYYFAREAARYAAALLDRKVTR
jgi:hypothetical protein